MSKIAPMRILLVEDDAALSEILCDELRLRDHAVVPAGTVAQGLEQLNLAEFDVALVDLMLPDGSGMDVLRHIAEQEPCTESIVLTGYATVSTAVEAMKLGAYDYVMKPVRMEEMEVLISRAGDKARLRRENFSLRLRLERQDRFEGLVTDDPAMKKLLATIERVAGSELPVLIQGKTGTGKELLARAVYQRSPRSQGPFVAVNCAAVPENLLESELFGYEKGAFTGALMRKPGLFEAADRGILFLDEIGDISPAVQAKLLRVIESKEFFRVGGTRAVRSDVRLVSATNKDLKATMQAGNFREDLYYRLNGLTLQVPPLSERRGDIPLLACHFIERFAPGKKLTPKALDALKGYNWPGNVRELQMVIQRAAILCPKDTIDDPDLPLELGTEQDWKVTALRSGLTLAEMEREYIAMVVDLHGGHRGKAAKALGIDPKTLYNKLGPERPRRDGSSDRTLAQAFSRKGNSS